MNLTLHLIRKDLFHFRWALLVWGASFAYLLLQANLTLTGSVTLRDYFQFVALLLFGLLSVGLIAEVMQEDHPNDSSGFWRTRPISPIRLLTAKLLLIGFLFIGLPLLAVWLKNRAPALQTVQSVREYCLIVLVLGSLVLSFAAAAVCTKSGAHSLLLWVTLIFSTATLAEFLGRFLPVLNRQMTAQMNSHTALAILFFSVVVSLAVILNQYLKRQLAVSIILMVTGVVSTALIGTMWSYYYFYHA